MFLSVARMYDFSKVVYGNTQRRRVKSIDRLQRLFADYTELVAEKIGIANEGAEREHEKSF